VADRHRAVVEGVSARLCIFLTAVHPIDFTLCAYLCELGYDDLSLSFGFIYVVIEKIIFILYIFVIVCHCFMLYCLTLCVMCCCCCLGQDYLVEEMFDLNEAFPD